LLSFKNISRAIILKKIEKDSSCLGFFYNSLNKKVKAFAKSSKTALSLKNSNYFTYHGPASRFRNLSKGC
jgi:hypothetical protein